MGEHGRDPTRDGLPGTRRPQCLRTPDTTAVRNVAFVLGRVERETQQPRGTPSMRMKVQIDFPAGRAP